MRLPTQGRLLTQKGIPQDRNCTTLSNISIEPKVKYCLSGALPHGGLCCQNINRRKTLYMLLQFIVGKTTTSKTHNKT